MSIQVFFALLVASAVFAVTPGPGIVAIIGRSLGSGAAPGLILGIGLILGDLCYLTLALLGLTWLEQTLGGFFVWVRLMGGIYLFWIGMQLFRAGDRPATTQAVIVRHPLREITTGLVISLSNPKVILFYLGFLPAFYDLSTLQASALPFLYLAIGGGLLTGVIAWACGISIARRVISGRGWRWLHRGAGALIAGTGIYIAGRS
ncbi:MAG: LysE family translocator [Arenicellales bacterium]|jgi:threonine/homoserine/homoserine lactone efflux protein|nr:LysE family translocator [Arenicellales bacterium]